MSESGSIEMEGESIRYRSLTYGDWSVHVDEVRVIGESTSQNGPFADDYFLCFATGPKIWHEASFYARGRETFLKKLSARLGVTLRLDLMGSTDFASRVIWPLELEGQPMFDYQEYKPKGRLARFVGSPIRMVQTYSQDVLSKLQLDGDSETEGRT